ncbi:MAG: bifunctional precorrin-2 dehydrogenase/sirohydrochlorin ferrochelatase [Anaerolineae bacterium]
MRYYPIALKITGRECVVVGGGEVAERKARSLLAADAQVTVVAPQATPGLRQLAAMGRIQWLQREVASGDLMGAAVVIVATDDPQRNLRVCRQARAQGSLVNVVDDPVHCDFIAPAVVQRGSVTIAVSTGGKSPALAAEIRRRIDHTIGDEYGALADLLGEMRGRVRAAIPDAARRAAFWHTLVQMDLLLDLLRQSDEQAARQRAESVLAAWQEPACE